jgi:PAS domain S-box-containing protein
MGSDAAAWAPLLDGLGTAAFVVSPDGVLTAMNSEAESRLGWKRDDACGRPLDALVAEVDRARVASAFRAGGAWRDETPVRLRGAGGDRAWRLTVLPLRAGDGAGKEGQVVVARAPAAGDGDGDAPAARPADPSLGDNAAILELILDNMTDGVIVAEPSGRFLLTNEAARRIAGVALEDTSPGEWTERYGLFFPDGVTRCPPETLPLARALRGEPVDAVELIIRNPVQPEGVRVSCTARPLRDASGALRGGFVVMRDVTRQRRDEEQLRMQKSLLEFQTEASVDGVLVVSSEGKMVSFNRRFVEMWGLPGEIVASRSDDAALASVFDKLVDPDGFLSKVRHLYAHPDEESRDEIALKDGRTFDRFSAPVRSAEGTHHGRVWFFRDISDRKRNELELQRSRERLLRQQKALIDITSNPRFQGGDLRSTLALITETAADTLGVARASVWRYTPDQSAILCHDLYETGSRRHSAGLRLEAADFPAYFGALRDAEVIDADDARTDPRTREYRDSYLVPLGITSMMDARIRVHGTVAGVICHEHVGPARRWTTDEQTFAVAVANLVSLALGRLEQQRLERRLAAQYAATRALAESATVAEAAPRILRAICESLGWEIGALWMPDTDGERLRCVELWRVPGLDADAFENDSRRRACARGEGVVGSVWAHRMARWVPDIGREPAFTRAQSATRAGLHAAVGFPVLRGEEAIGVIEFYSREIQEPDEDLLRMLSSIGSQIGQFVERTRAEEALRASEEKFRALAETANDAIVSIDRDGRVIYFNKGAERIFGYSAAEISGLPLVSIMPERLRAEHEAGFRRYLDTGQARVLGRPIELAGRRKDGSEVPLEVSLAAWRTGTSLFFTGILRDITERKRTEQDLQRSTAELKAVVAALPDLIFRLDAQDRIIEYHAPNREMLYAAPERFIGRRPTEVLPEAIAAVLTAGMRRTRESGSVVTVEYSLPMPEGERFFEARIVPLAEHHLLAVVRDTTERHLAEQRIRRAAEETREAYRNLKNAQEQVIRAEKLASVGMVMAGIAHEINNPLNVMYGNLRLMKERLGDAGRNVSQMMRDALTAAENARRIIEEFRHFARERGAAEHADLRGCVEGAVEQVRALAGRRVRLASKIGRIPPMRMFPGQLRRAFANLLKNAVEATEGRGTVSITAKRRGKHAVVVVKDTGRGIEKADLPRIFEPFFTTKEYGKGFGLGLALTQAIIQNHRGEIAVKSQVGKGTTFTIKIPI